MSERDHMIQILLLAACFAGHLYADAYHEQTTFAIVTGSYNNSEWCERNIELLFTQDYDNWHLFYVDDCSQDDTVYKVESLIKRFNKADKVTDLENLKKSLSFYNPHVLVSASSKETLGPLKEFLKNWVRPAR